MNATPMPAAKALDAFFLEARCRLLDLAAILDRINRGAGANSADLEPRLTKIRHALDILGDEGDGRAECIQKLFSLEYDPAWKKPQPRF